jgi:hypothetical protein
MDEHTAELEALVGRLDALSADVEDVSAQPDTFAKEMKNINEDIAKLLVRLDEIRIEKRELAANNDKVAALMFQSEQTAMFLGTLQKSIEIYESKPDDESSIEGRLAEVRSRVLSLRAKYSREAIEQRQNEVLGKINDDIQSMLSNLDAEYPEWPVSLDSEELSLKITDDSGDERDLWQIGSGANWLSYHVSTALALQRHFLRQSHSPVPSFLVLDQPSQVYFPKAAYDKKAGDFTYQQEDIAEVRKVFKALSDEVAASGGSLQVIVLDHAREEVWEDLKGVVKIEEWRGGKKLVPDDWPAFELSE